MTQMRGMISREDDTKQKRLTIVVIPVIDNKGTYALCSTPHFYF